ncbi:MAG: type II toxin-antitoxin system RelE/ParE family toxin [Xanthobacteraceae bacterium]|nr:type II toxin-antitoxin system RelE/ParE family toxin [Xanthobacteraceae bacterium]
MLIYATDPSDLVAESRPQGVREIPAGSPGHDACGADYRGRGRQGGHCQAVQGRRWLVFKIALKYRGDAYRTIYAVQLGPDLIVIDAFQKKSKSGIKTPQVDVDRIKERIKRLKEGL